LPAVSVPCRSNGRFQRGELFQRRVASDVVVALEAAKLDDEIVEESFVEGRGCFAVTFQRELILLGARDLPSLRHLLAALAHRQTGVRLRDRRQLRLEMTRPQSEPRRQPRPERFGARAAQQDAAIRVRVDHRHVAGRVDAGSDAGIDLSHRDLQADDDRCIQARATRALQIERGRLARETAVEHALARQAEVARMLEHRAGADVAERRAFQSIAFDQRSERRRQHFLVARFGVRAHRACEGDAHAADDGDPAHCRSDEHDGLAVREWRLTASMPAPLCR
jgi:hypothetical protein